MRISDWSSDVCSSDLMIAPVTHTIAAHSESDIDRQWFRGIAPAIEGWTGLYGGSDDGRSVGRLERHLPVFDLKRPEGLCPQSFIGLSATSRTGSLRGWNVIGRSAARSGQIGRAHAGTPITNAHLVCRLLLEKKTNTR